MADKELVMVLDYILNRCGEAEIEVIAASVVRRKRDLAMFGSAKMMDPTRWAKQTAQALNQSSGLSLASVRNMVRDMAANMLRQEAPELDDVQIDELLDAWVPDGDTQLPVWQGGGTAGDGDALVEADGEAANLARHLPRSAKGVAPRKKLPPEVLLSMAKQFVSFSSGKMTQAENAMLRKELDNWPQKYWHAFPGGVRAIISDYLKNGGSPSAFEAKLRSAVELG